MFLAKRQCCQLLLLLVACRERFGWEAGAVGKGNILQLDPHSRLTLTPIKVSRIIFFPDARKAGWLNGIPHCARADGDGTSSSCITDLEGIGGDAFSSLVVQAEPYLARSRVFWIDEDMQIDNFKGEAGGRDQLNLAAVVASDFFWPEMRSRPRIVVKRRRSEIPVISIPICDE